jgi:hypothetical protein
VVGTSDGEGATLLPAKLLSSLAAEPKPDGRVRLGGAQAYRYVGVPLPDGSKAATIFASPTDDGVVTVVCQGARPSVLDECERAAATLRLSGAATSLPLGPREEYAKPIASALSRLVRDRRAAERGLASAKTRKGQASNATTVAAAYRRAAHAVAAAPAGPLERRAGRSLQRSLAKVAHDYDAMASAARRADRSAYGRARTHVLTDSEAVGKAVSTLRALGYGAG